MTAQTKFVPVQEPKLEVPVHFYVPCRAIKDGQLLDDVGFLQLNRQLLKRLVEAYNTSLDLSMKEIIVDITDTLMSDDQSHQTGTLIRASVVGDLVKVESLIQSRNIRMILEDFSLPLLLAALRGESHVDSAKRFGWIDQALFWGSNGARQTAEQLHRKSKGQLSMSEVNAMVF